MGLGFRVYGGGSGLRISGPTEFGLACQAIGIVAATENPDGDSGASSPNASTFRNLRLKIFGDVSGNSV